MPLRFESSSKCLVTDPTEIIRLVVVLAVAFNLLVNMFENQLDASCINTRTRTNANSFAIHAKQLCAGLLLFRHCERS